MMVGYCSGRGRVASAGMSLCRGEAKGGARGPWEKGEWRGKEVPAGAAWGSVWALEGVLKGGGSEEDAGVP